MNTSPTLLIFAYHFPPDGAIGAQRPYRFYKYLSRRGVRCRIFTAAKGAAKFTPDAQEIPDPFEQAHRDLGWKMELAVRKVFIPGETGLRWALQACGAAQRYLRQLPAGSRTVIFSSFPPLGANLAPWLLNQREGIPWVADYRDPLGRSLGDLTPRHHRINRWFEQTSMTRTAAVIANTDSAAERLRQTYPAFAAKVHLIWNGFDPEERLQPLPIPARPYKLISHVGELYRGRTVKPVLEAVQRLIDRGKLSPACVRFQLVGPVEPESLPAKDVLARAQEQGWLELSTASVPRAEAHKIAASSEGLLLLQPQSALQVPGKIFEYLQLGRPVLAFLAPESPSERILQQSGIPYRCLFPDQSAEKTEEAIAEFTTLLTGESVLSTWFEDNFSADRQTSALQQIIGECQ